MAALRLGDINWRTGELLVRGKGDRREPLPLPVDVGEAVTAYLRRGRPPCDDQHLSLRVKAPTMRLKGDGITKVVQGACWRGGVPMVGAHRLRREETLRQRSDYTQAPYAKVDRAALERVVRPWPAMSQLDGALDDYLKLRRHSASSSG